MSANGAVILATLAGTPAVTLAHELGHAAAGLRFTRGPVLVRVGRADAAIRLRFGRLFVLFSPFGAGGFCRTQGRVTRRQALVRVLAGPAVNLMLAPLLWWLASEGPSGTTRAILLTLALLNSVALLNLVPHRTQWNPITRGLPSDGLQALCLLRRRPLPPPAPPRAHTGLRTPLSAYQIVLTLAGIPLWAVLAANHLNQPALCLWLSLGLQGALGASRSSQGQSTQGAQPRRQPRVSSLPPKMKTCPKCGAQVRAAARLCFCYHQFGDAAGAETAPIR